MREEWWTEAECQIPQPVQRAANVGKQQQPRVMCGIQTSKVRMVTALGGGSNTLVNTGEIDQISKHTEDNGS